MSTTIIDTPIGFKEIAATARCVNSKDSTMKLNECIEYELRELMQKINEYNKGGKLTITLEIDPAERKEELDIRAEVKATKPKGKKPSNTFYRDQKGGIFFDVPGQGHLFDKKTISSLDERRNNG